MVCKTPGSWEQVLGQFHPFSALRNKLNGSSMWKDVLGFERWQFEMVHVKYSMTLQGVWLRSEENKHQVVVFRVRKFKFREIMLTGTKHTPSFPEAYTLVAAGLVYLPVWAVLQNRHKDRGHTNCRNQKAIFKNQFDSYVKLSFYNYNTRS